MLDLSVLQIQDLGIAYPVSLEAVLGAEITAFYA
jgi:hypothetical protein